MSIAIRHTSLNAPHAPFLAALVSSLRPLFGLPEQGAPKTSAERAQDRKAPSVFHRWAASDLAFRDVGRPFFSPSLRP